MSCTITEVCEHSQQLMYCKYVNCSLCGAILSYSDLSHNYTCTVIKDQAFSSQTDISASQLYSAMLNDQYATRFYNPTADYLKSRLSVVNWLKELTNKLDLTTTTLHIAVAYMDYVLSRHNFSTGKFNLVALTCLIIATKYDELDRNIPSLLDFMGAARSMLLVKPNDVKSCEAKILGALSWNLCVITPLNFLDILFTQGVLHISDKIIGGKEVSVETAKEITRQSKSLLDFLLNGTNSN